MVSDYCKHYIRRYRKDNPEVCMVCDEVDAARLDAAKLLRDWIVDHSFVPPMILAMDDAALARIVAPKEGE